MKYKVAICDDCEIDRVYLSSILEHYKSLRDINFTIDSFCSAEEFLLLSEGYFDYEIILLDIEMQRMDGVELAKRIRKISDSVQIIFITGFSDYILSGYDVAALNYLMKPVEEKKLISVLDKAVENLGKNERVLNINCSNELVRIPIYKIRYAEVYGNYVTIHSESDIKVKMTLQSLEEKLDERFYKVGRSYIVNLTEITRVTKSEIKLNDGSVIPVPRGAYDKINRAIIEIC